MRAPQHARVEFGARAPSPGSQYPSHAVMMFFFPSAVRTCGRATGGREVAGGLTGDGGERKVGIHGPIGAPWPREPRVSES
jgi:hypothetical protein